MGVEHVIDRNAEGFRFWTDDDTQDPAEWRRFGKRIRELAGTDPDIVFEHPGRSTMGASVFVCTRGGTIVTCAATTGFMIEYDNRYLWMHQKTLKGCHFANYREAWEANRLVAEGRIHPVLSAVFPFEEVAEAVLQVHHNQHEGKLGVRVLAPAEGLGVTDPELRAQHLDQITVFRRPPAQKGA
jgi:crotonyl-CoA reductase